jgi:hypothetical protein
LATDISPPTEPRRRSRIWLWAALAAGFVFIFWDFIPKDETVVPFSPWFLDQVAEGNVRSLLVNGTEARGELIEPRDFWTGRPDAPAINVRKYIVRFPSAEDVHPVVEDLLAWEGPDSERVYIEAASPHGVVGSYPLLAPILALFVIFTLLWARRASREVQEAASRRGGTPPPEPPGPATP